MVKLALGAAGAYALRWTGRASADTGTGAGRGSVSGTVTYAGELPPHKAIKVTQDVAVCGKHAIFDEGLVVGKKRGLANAVVAIEGVAGAAAGKKDLLLDQRECVFKPHVQATTRGSKLVVRNSDPILNTPHAYMGRRTLFNVAQPFQDMKYSYKLKKAGVIRMKCDVHDWESAYILVFDHPFFAVTGADGSFRIPDVPAGSYTARVWHEKLGEKTATVTVGSGTAELAFEY